MKIATFDSGFTYDDPNLIWGDPAMLLEPGDAGYVNPFSSVKTTNKKGKNMKHNSYYPSRQGDQAGWLQNVANKIGGYATTLGLTTSQTNAIKADCLWVYYLLQLWLPEVRSFGLTGAQALQEAQTGTGSSTQILPTFTAPALPTGTVAVNSGALTRIFAAVQLIKSSGKLTDAIATDLGFTGSTQTGPDLTTLQPVLDLSLVAGQVFIKWGWQGYSADLDSLEIQVDRGDSRGFVLLTIDTTPNYTDTQLLPAVPTKWSYRGIFRVGDQQVGQWSDIKNITVNN